MFLELKIKELLQSTQSSVRNERIALALSQKEFANFVGVSYATYRAFEQDGKISLENFILILNSLGKSEEYKKFLDGFEYDNAKKRVSVNRKNNETKILKPIVSPTQKQIVLDKQIFGYELFYSVENGHTYDVSNFISIILKNCNDEKMSLLLKYFGEERVKPYILKEKNIELLERFNKHISFLKRLDK